MYEDKWIGRDSELEYRGDTQVSPQEIGIFAGLKAYLQFSEYLVNSFSQVNSLEVNSLAGVSSL